MSIVWYSTIRALVFLLCRSPSRRQPLDRSATKVKADVGGQGDRHEMVLHRSLATHPLLAALNPNP